MRSIRHLALVATLVACVMAGLQLPAQSFDFQGLIQNLGAGNGSGLLNNGIGGGFLNNGYGNGVLNNGYGYNSGSGLSGLINSYGAGNLGAGNGYGSGFSNNQYDPYNNNGNQGFISRLLGGNASANYGLNADANNQYWNAQGMGNGACNWHPSGNHWWNGSGNVNGSGSLMSRVFNGHANLQGNVSLTDQLLASGSFNYGNGYNTNSIGQALTQLQQQYGSQAVLQGLHGQTQYPGMRDWMINYVNGNRF